MLGINKASAARAAQQGVTNLVEYDVQPGDLIYPDQFVVSVGDGGESHESFYFNGGPNGVAIPLGTVIAEFSDPNQERRFGVGGDGSVGRMSDVFVGDDIIPVPPATGTKINFPPDPTPVPQEAKRHSAGD